MSNVWFFFLKRQTLFYLIIFDLESLEVEGGEIGITGKEEKIILKND